MKNTKTTRIFFSLYAAAVYMKKGTLRKIIRDMASSCGVGKKRARKELLSPISTLATEYFEKLNPEVQFHESGASTWVKIGGVKQPLDTLVVKRGIPFQLHTEWSDYYGDHEVKPLVIVYVENVYIFD